MDFVSFLGRLHPVVLHLPIGALFMILVAELWLLRAKEGREQRLLLVFYFFAFLTSLAAVATGLILSREDAYGGSTLDLHQKLGIATGVLTMVLIVFAYLAARTAGNEVGKNLWIGVRRLGLFLALGLITITGHYGGEMTHGKGFLFEYGPAFLQEQTEPEPVEITAEITVFEAAINPIIQNNCVYCHDDETTKGKLRMDSPEAMLAGGRSGRLFVAGDVENSLMLQRIHLPDDHEEHMPPIEKQQPSEAEIAALTWWIGSGASFEMKLSAAEVPESVHALVPSAEKEKEVFVPEGELNLQVIQELRDQLLTVQRIQQGEDQLWINFSAIATTAGDEFVQQLRPLANFIVWLDLARTQITDASMSTVALMQNLEELNLNSCQITDEGVKQLQGLDNLKDLNLTQTAVSEASLPTLIQLEALETVHLFGTQWTPEGAEVFRRIRPDITVNFGE
ncbi:MAG TPA: c-type cytochrome domain-containing protein [Opitutales bacterium]|nr:c-type cytochrome domain-containing protein [Opitutales bacterium]